MKLGYNTNGLACHDWRTGIELLAEIGYRAVAITVDHHCLNPFSEGFSAQFAEMRRLLERLHLASVVETGARFLLDSRLKHEPTLISPTVEGRARRIDFLCRCINIARELNSEAVSFWSGVKQDLVSAADAELWLTDGCRQVTDAADRSGVTLAFEPEPGMFVETLEQYGRLAERIGSDRFGLTIDIGHVQCVEAGSIPDHLRRWSAPLRNIHIEDMRRGIHEHLRFGEGEIDFPPVLATLREIGYSGCINIELSRHSHMAPEVMQESWQFLTQFQ